MPIVAHTRPPKPSGAGTAAATRYARAEVTARHAYRTDSKNGALLALDLKALADVFAGVEAGCTCGCLGEVRRG